MSISIWDYEKPLDAMMLNHDHIAALVMKHEKEIQELKQLVTPMMEFKRREWIGLTHDERVLITDVARDDLDAMILAEAKLREKNT
jgi:hypothetical protein